MTASQSVRHVRLFKNGRSQAVRIPRDFELPGDEATMRRDERGRLILEPMPRPDILDLLASWTPLKEKDQMLPIEDRPAEPVDL
jgi:antitoxin VapB